MLTDARPLARTARQALADAPQTVAAAVNFARDLVNMPPNDLYPESFADELKSRRKRHQGQGLGPRREALEAKGYGGILGVGQGSASPPRLVKLTYKPAKPIAHLALVGKGITFDSGGLSIKPANSMVDDEVRHGRRRRRRRRHVRDRRARAAGARDGVRLPGREHAVGQRDPPGDVLTMYGGKTVEVLNTDAEGRLVLADGITTATERQARPASSTSPR